MNRRLRILSVIGDLGFGGDENRLLALARSINRDRFDHWIVTVNPIDPARAESWAMLQQYRQAGVEVMQLQKGRSSRIARFIQRIFELCKLVERLDIDLIDAHCQTAALLGTLAGVTTGRPRIVTQYHAHALFAPRFWGVAEQFVFTCANRMITDSGVRAREIQEAAQFKRPEVAVIPNGVSPPRPVRDGHDVRRQLQLPEGEDVQVIGQISALRQFKGQLILLDAAKTVLASNPNVVFLIVGYEKDEPGFKQRLEKRALELGISDRVRITAYPGSIGDIWGVIDIHVHASQFDSLPNAIIEGMSLGKPAVVTAVGGVPDAVTHSETGLVVPPGDDTALAAALNQLLNDPQFARKLGEAALCRYRRRYREELMARRLESCFVEVIRGCSAASHLSNESA